MLSQAAISLQMSSGRTTLQAFSKWRRLEDYAWISYTPFAHEFLARPTQMISEIIRSSVIQ